MVNKKSPMTEARKTANAKYDSKAYDKILLRVRTGRKQEIESHASIYQLEAGEIGRAGYSPAGSLQGFINRAIDEQIERDKSTASPSPIIMKEAERQPEAHATIGEPEQPAPTNYTIVKEDEEDTYNDEDDSNLPASIRLTREMMKKREAESKAAYNW